MLDAAFAYGTVVLGRDGRTWRNLHSETEATQWAEFLTTGLGQSPQSHPALEQGPGHSWSL